MRVSHACSQIYQTLCSLCLVVCCIAVTPCLAQPSSSTDAAVASDPDKARDTLLMKNGNSVTGIILEETDLNIRILVFVGDLRAETSFARDEVASVKRGWVDPAIAKEADARKEPIYTKPPDVVLATPALLRASAVLQNTQSPPSGKGIPVHEGQVTLCVYSACSQEFTNMFAPGGKVKPGAVVRFCLADTVSSAAKLTLKDEKRIQHALAKKAVDTEWNVDDIQLRLYAEHGGSLLEGRLRRAVLQEATPSPGKCPSEEFERPLVIEWRKPRSPVGTNALLLTMYGSTWQRLATEFEAIAVRSDEEVAAAEDLLTNGIPVGCSHCGGDGQLTGADSSRFTLEEAEDYQRRVSAAAAGAGNGFTRIRIVISCRQCRGQGTLGNKRPSGALAQQVREFQRLHERNASTCHQSAKDLLAKVKQWEASPSGSPDLAVEEARLKLQEQDLRRIMNDAPRSKEVLDEIKRLLRRE